MDGLPESSFLTSESQVGIFNNIRTQKLTCINFATRVPLLHSQGLQGKKESGQVLWLKEGYPFLVTCSGWCTWMGFHLNQFSHSSTAPPNGKGVYSICFLHTIHENQRLSILMQTWSLVIESWHCHFLELVLYYHVPHQLQETAQD